VAVDVSLPSEQQIEQLRHWLDLLSNLPSGANSNYSILLVGTKIDKLSSKYATADIADVLIQEFQKWGIELRHIDSIIFISNLKGTGILLNITQLCGEN
jgi:GTPase SAR1 family protein